MANASKIRIGDIDYDIKDATARDSALTGINVNGTAAEVVDHVAEISLNGIYSVAMGNKTVRFKTDDIAVVFFYRNTSNMGILLCTREQAVNVTTAQDGSWDYGYEDGEYYISYTPSADAYALFVNATDITED